MRNHCQAGGLLPSLPLRAASLIVALLTGCECVKENSFTGQLWTSDQFAHFRGPDLRAPVTVHSVPNTGYHLVAYTEVRDGDEHPRARVLPVGPESPTEPGVKPAFARGAVGNLPRVPETNDPTQIPRVNVVSNTVVIFTPQAEERYILPEYQSDSGVGAKTALTPLAVVGDVGIVSLIAALIAAIGLAHSGASFSP